MSVHELRSRRRRAPSGLAKARGQAERAVGDADRFRRDFDPFELVADARERLEEQSERRLDRALHRGAGEHSRPGRAQHRERPQRPPDHDRLLARRARRPTPAPAPSRLARAASFIAAHRLSLGIAAALALVSALIHAVGIEGWPRLEEDEGTYIFQAWAVKELGDLAPYTYWYDHPPLGWLVIAGWWAAIGDLLRIDDPYLVSRSLMVLLQAISAGLVYAIARRLELRRGFAALAAALFSLSPLAIELQRVGYLDNVAVPFMLGAFLLMLTRTRALWAFAAAAALFGAAVLIKETFLLLLPGLALIAWRNSDRSTRRFCLGVAGAVLAVVGGTYVLFALLKGELLPGEDHVSLWEGVAFQLFDRREGGSIFDAATENGATVAYWLDLDRILPAVMLAALPFGLFVKRLQPVALALALPLLMLLRPGYVPHMYVIALLPFFGLLIAGAADWVWGRWEGAASPLRRAPKLAVVAALGAFAVVVSGPWGAKYEQMTSEDRNTPYREAASFAAAEIPGDAKLLVEASMWLPLVEQGREIDDVVWFYKLDHDPGVGEDYPNGWRDLDYVIASQLVRITPEVPQTQEAIANSRRIASFGSGADLIEIRKVQDEPAISVAAGREPDEGT